MLEIYSSKSEIEKKINDTLSSNENIIGTFKNLRKTSFKVFGNKITDYIQITNSKVIYIQLVKYMMFDKKNSQYLIKIIPFREISNIANAGSEVTISIKNDTSPAQLKLLLGNEANTLTSIINPYITVK